MGWGGGLKWHLPMAALLASLSDISYLGQGEFFKNDRNSHTKTKVLKVLWMNESNKESLQLLTSFSATFH